MYYIELCVFGQLLCCVVLCCVVLCFAVLTCVDFRGLVLSRVVSCDVALHCVVLCCDV